MAGELVGIANGRDTTAERGRTAAGLDVVR
jgi:hypothetical protein